MVVDCMHFLHLVNEVACCMRSPHIYKGLGRVGLQALPALIDGSCLLHAFPARLQGTWLELHTLLTLID